MREEGLLRRHLKAAVSKALAWTGGDRLFGAITGHRGHPLIVGYHRVVEDFTAMKPTSIPAMLITCRTFEQQIDWIARRFRITTLDEIGSRLESGEPSDERLAAITFDDGYADLYHNAFPILRRKGHPAAVFVVTDLIGRKDMQTFDRLYLLLARALGCPGGIDWLPRLQAVPAAERRRLSRFLRDPIFTTTLLLKALPQDALGSVLEALECRFPMAAECFESHRSLDWNMLDEMSAAGITIGSHSRTHPLLTLEEPARVREEVEGSRRLLEQSLGRAIHHFAYPDGRFSTQVVAAVKKAGYRFAYGVCGHRDASEPLLTIPRRTLWEYSCLDGRGRHSPSVMSCNVNGVFDLFARCRREHQAVGVAYRTAMAGLPAAAGASGRSQERGSI